MILPPLSTLFNITIFSFTATSLLVPPNAVASVSPLGAYNIMTPQSICKENTDWRGPHTSSIHQTNACLSQRSCAMKPANLLVTCSNLSKPYERLFYRRFKGRLHVRNWKQAAYGCFQSNSSSLIRLKSKPRIDSEILRIV